MSKCPYFTGTVLAQNPSHPKDASKQNKRIVNLKCLNRASYLNDFNYAEEFKKLDLDALKQDLVDVMRTSQEWWPADYGHYGPLMIRLAWHSAGTYRTFDGRGGANTGNMRFAPLNSWPDNGNLDKARDLLWPIKRKYGKKLSWGDLMVFAGNVALEDMGFKTLGFGGGRVDCWAPEEDIWWGNETEMLGDERHGADGAAANLEKGLGADHMGLIYVNPEGPGGNPDPLASAKHIRETFGRMAMNDEETVALIAGGHTFGKGHGAANPGKFVGPEPEAAGIEAQGRGWKNGYETGRGVHAITSGLEGAWTTNPTKWDNGYFENLFKYEWECKKGPGGANQWYPKDNGGADSVPDAHDKEKKHQPTMFTTDIALKEDPIYAPISKRFHENPADLEKAFAHAWYKLTHRDMGPRERCLGKLVPEVLIWQDPCPEPPASLPDAAAIKEMKSKIIGSGISIPQLVRTAWASASTFRCTDFRGGANGARIRLAPQKDWAVNDPKELTVVLNQLQGLKTDAFSLADMIVLGGCAAVEEAAKKGGETIEVPFKPGRTDASEEQTDGKSFDVLEPTADGFRNYNSTTHQLIDRAHMLSLTAPEMTVLVGGLRALNANSGESHVGVLTKQPGVLTNDFFTNLLDTSAAWSHVAGDTYQSGTWTASEVDLLFGSNSELRAIAEYYACDNSEFVSKFVAAWNKVMSLDRFR